MNKSQKANQNIVHKAGQSKEIKTEGPLSEKDEVKAAERKLAKNIKKAAKETKQ